MHSLLPNQEEPNAQVAVPVIDDDTVADQLSASHGLPIDSLMDSPSFSYDVYIV